MRFYTTEKLSRTRELTPEGYLLCRNVAVCRIGKQQYASGEVPVPPGPDGTIWIDREPEEVFRPETIDSYSGKPVVDDHPPLGVKLEPDTWRKYTVGIVLNPRRGDGVQFDNDFMYADFLITDPDRIEELKPRPNGDVPDQEVSAGYDAEYDETGPGHGRQRDIIGNHVALVDRGRCGPRCAIGDSAMPKFNFKSFRDKIMGHVALGDADGVGEELKKLPEMLGDIVSDADAETEKDGHHITVNVHGARGEPTSMAGQDRRVHDDDGEGDGDHASTLKDLADRVGAIEEALSMLAGEEGDEGGEAGQGQDRRMTRYPGAPKKTRDRMARAQKAYDAIMDAEEEEEEGDPADGGDEPKWKAARKGAEETEDADEEGKEDHDDPEEKKADEVKKGATGDRRRATGDRAAVGDSTSLRVAFTEMLSRAETLCPGLTMPTFDRHKSAKITTADMCGFRRRALSETWRTNDSGKAAIESVIGDEKPNFRDGQMTCDAVKTIFNASSALLAGTTSAQYRPNGSAMRQTGAQQMPTPADINKRNRELYNGGTKH